jgi:hypothetical protein
VSVIGIFVFADGAAVWEPPTTITPSLAFPRPVATKHHQPAAIANWFQALAPTEAGWDQTVRESGRRGCRLA